MPKSLSLLPFFVKTCLFLFYSFPSSQILPAQKHKSENERQKWWSEKSLRGEGPIKQAPFPSKECAQNGVRWKKFKKKICSLYFLKIDFFLYSKRNTNREADWGLDLRRERIEGGGQVVSNTKADERSLLAEETVWWRLTLYALRTHLHTPSNKHKPLLAKILDFHSNLNHCLTHFPHRRYSLYWFISLYRVS